MNRRPPAEMFTCERCGKTAVKVRPDAEAETSAAINFPELLLAEEEPAVICDDCFQAFAAWFLAVYGRELRP